MLDNFFITMCVCVCVCVCIGWSTGCVIRPNYEVVVFLPRSGTTTALDSINILMCPFYLVPTQPLLSTVFWAYPANLNPTLYSVPAPNPHSITSHRPIPPRSHTYTCMQPGYRYLSASCTFTPIRMISSTPVLTSLSFPPQRLFLIIPQFLLRHPLSTTRSSLPVSP